MSYNEQLKKRMEENADLMYAALLEVSAFFADPGLNKDDAVGTNALVDDLLKHIISENHNIDDIKELIRGKLVA